MGMYNPKISILWLGLRLKECNSKRSISKFLTGQEKPPGSTNRSLKFTWKLWSLELISRPFDQ